MNINPNLNNMHAFNVTASNTTLGISNKKRNSISTEMPKVTIREKHQMSHSPIKNFD